MAKLTGRSSIASIRLTPENLAAGELVAAITSRSLSGLVEHALALYIQKNYPDAYKPGVRLTLKLDEAPDAV